MTSEPEWGVNVSKKNMPELGRYAFGKTLDELPEADG